MIRATVKAYSREESKNEARIIGANWFGCRPDEVSIVDDHTEAETEYEETSDMIRTMMVPTGTVYYTQYRIFGPGEF